MIVVSGIGTFNLFESNVPLENGKNEKGDLIFIELVKKISSNSFSYFNCREISMLSEIYNCLRDVLLPTGEVI